MGYYSSMLWLFPAIIFAFIVQSVIAVTYTKYSKVRSVSGYTGRKLARTLLDSQGLFSTSIETVPGVMSDHFDPVKNAIRLSSSTIDDDSVATMGVVAHETGHVIQLKEKYPPMVLRNLVVPIAQFGSSFAWILFFLGLFLSFPVLIQFGIWLFIAVVFFTLITLPVEYNASRRALGLLQNQILLDPEELKMVKKVLNAAALTYVATTLMAVFNLFRMFAISKR
jgi:Zn-dependent membrane protease YugP